MKIVYSSKFKREYKKLPAYVKDLAEEKEKIFRKDIFDSQLDTHKLHGKFKDYWSFSIGSKYRIVFEFSDDKKEIHFLSVGDHDVYI